MIKNYDMVEVHIFQLLDKDNRWWTLEEIASELQLAKATAQKYIYIIRKRLLPFSKEDIFLEVLTSQGIRLHRKPSFNTHQVYSDILKRQLAFSLIDSTLKYGHLSTVKVALDNFTSVASVRRKYLSLNTTLARVNLSIKNNMIRGKEEEIRWFYSEYYWQIFKGTEWPFPSISQAHTHHLIERIEQHLNISIVPEVKEKISYWIAINHIRSAKGYWVSEDPELKKYMSHNPHFSLFLECLNDYHPAHNKVAPPQKLEEAELLFFVFSSLSAAERNKDFTSRVFQAHQEGNTLMYQMTRDWLFLYERYFYDTDFHYKQVQSKLLQIHSFSYLYTVDDTLLIKTNYSKELIQNYPRFFKRIKKVYDILSSYYPSITKNKRYLMENYTLIAIEHLALDKFEPVIRIAFSFSEGHLYELVGQKKLSEHFSGKYNIAYVEHFETRDILITDLPQLISNPPHLIISVDLQLRKRDFYNIEQAILKTLKKLNTK